MPFFNWNIEAGFEIPIYSGQGDRDVKWNHMPPGHYCLSVGADFVGDLAGAAESAIAADDHQIDLPALHQVAGRIVGDDLVRNSLLG